MKKISIFTTVLSLVVFLVLGGVSFSEESKSADVNGAAVSAGAAQDKGTGAEVTKKKGVHKKHHHKKHSHKKRAAK